MIVNMDIREIIETDIAKNHDIDLEEALRIFDGYIKAGYSVSKINDTVFIYKADNKTVNYHSINAASMKNYVANVTKFFEQLQDYSVAVTHLTNPKLKGLIKRYLPKSIRIEGDNAITDLENI